MSYNSCILCLNSSKKTPGISLHLFPKAPLLRCKWLDACGLSETDVAHNRKICSFHFSQECYTTGYKKVLKPGSIPTIKIRKSVNRKVFNPLSIESKLSTSSAQLSKNKEPLEECEQIITVGLNECFEKDFEHLVEKSIIDTIETPKRKVPILEELSDQLIEDTSKQKKKRTFFLGDIKSPDLSTPRRSKKHFQMAKLHVMKQRKKIKDLNQTVRRLRKKLSSFEALFRHLKSNNLITENAHDDILVLLQIYDYYVNGVYVLVNFRYLKY